MKPTHRILCNIYYVERLGDFYQEAVPSYELEEEGYNPELLCEGGVILLYIEQDEEGWYEDDGFESERGSTTRIDESYIEKIY